MVGVGGNPILPYHNCEKEMGMESILDRAPVPSAAIVLKLCLPILRVFSFWQNVKRLVHAGVEEEWAAVDVCI